MRSLALLSIAALTSLAACQTPADETSPALPDEANWTRSFGDAFRLEEIRVAAAPDGRLALAGSFAGTLDFGGGALTSEDATNDADRDVFCASLAADGSHRWSGAARAAKVQSATGVAIDAEGNATFTGSFRNEIDFGEGPMKVLGTGTWLARFDASGKVAWSTAVAAPDPMNTSVQVTPSAGIALAPDGTIVVAGILTGVASFGDKVVFGGAGTFVARLDEKGHHVQSFMIDGHDHNPEAVAVTPAGDVLVAGDYRGQIGLGETQLSTQYWAQQGYLASIAADGSPNWLIATEGLGRATVTSVAPTADGGAIIGGCTEGSTKLGNHELAGLFPSNGFVARIGSGGGIEQVTVLPATCVASVAVDAAGWIHAGGHYTESPDLGTGALHYTSTYAPVVVELDEKAKVAAVRTFGDDAWGKVTGILVNRGDLVISGTFGTITIDGPTLTSKGESDLFVARTR